MKILMFGRGVIATIYGWALEQAGHEIEFYVRPGRAELYGDSIDLDLLDARRRIWGERVLQRWSARYRETLEPDHTFDLILVSVAHTRVPEAVRFLATRLGKATVLIFSNLWTDPLRVVECLPTAQVAWGFPGAGGGFDPSGTLYGALLPSVVFGTFGEPLTERELAVRKLFREAGFKLSEQPDFRGWLQLHFILNAGIHSQGLRAGSLAKLAGNRTALRDALLTARELLPLVEAHGVDLGRHRGMVTALRAPSWAVAQLLAWATRYLPPARRSFEAVANTAAEEPRAICRDTLAEAARLGLPNPRLEMAEPLFGLNLPPIKAF